MRTPVGSIIQWSIDCTSDNMLSNIHEVNVHGVLQNHNVRYEVRPYYVVFERRPVGGPLVDQRIQAGFDLDLYGTLNKIQLPLFESDEGHRVVDYFQTLAKEIQSKFEEHGTKVEVIPYADSLVLDTHQHLQPEVVLRIRITHARGLDQPGGPFEEEAVNTIRELLHQLEVKQA